MRAQKVSIENTKKIKIYVAGRVSNNSVFGTHDWRDKFLDVLSKLSGLKFINLDPIKKKDIYQDLEIVFGGDVYLISQADVVVVYLTDDVGLGAAQEILVAKYYDKPVIGLAPKGGKFNGRTKKIGDLAITDYKHPFVFSTCDVVCGDIEEVARALKNLAKIKPKNIDLLKTAAAKYQKRQLPKDIHIKQILKV
jgi:hypothetical protein